MKKALLFSIVLVLAVCGIASAATAVVAVTSRAGGFAIVTLTLVGDEAGGAVTAEDIDLSFILTGEPYYLYYVETIPTAAAPDAYTVTLTDADGGTVLALSARSTSAKEYADASEDLPNYWPVVGDLTLAATDIGASNSTVIRLIFTK